jgi:hypothetical protein
MTESSSKLAAFRSGFTQVRRIQGTATAFGWTAGQLYDQFRQATGFDFYNLISTNIYDHEWDLLIILDACRVDLLNEVADEYDYLDSLGSIVSVGEDSTQWLKRTFTESHSSLIDETDYVTGNPHTDAVFGSRPEPANVDEVWKYAFDSEKGMMPARPITDQAIATARESTNDRMIVHYMQPHFPAVSDMELGDPMNLNTDDHWYSVWDQLKAGEVDQTRVWEAYRENLRYVLDEVDLLLLNVDADRAVITADHANAFGELGFWGHRRHPVMALRRVPWCVTDGTDTGSYSPSLEQEADDEPDVNEQLEALGYR